MRLKLFLLTLGMLMLGSAAKAQFITNGNTRIYTTDSVGVGGFPGYLFHLMGNVAANGSLGYIRVINGAAGGSALTIEVPQGIPATLPGNFSIFRGVVNGQTVAGINRLGSAFFNGSLNVDGQATIDGGTRINNNLTLRHPSENTNIFFNTHNGRTASVGLQDDGVQGFYIQTDGTYRFSINQNGNVAIGTALAPSGYRLSVDGRVICEEVRVQLSSQWPDYVFAKNYKLIPLLELEKNIKANGHLPGIPSAQEVQKNGIAVGEMQAKMMEKLEELTLYVIELKKENEALKKAIHGSKSKK